MRLFILFVLLPLASVSQDYKLWRFEDSSEHYVFGDTAFVRSSPSLNAAVIDTLFAGQDVLMVRCFDKDAIVKGILAPWVNVRYIKNGSTKTGCMWAGLLSFQPLRRGVTKFVYGVDRLFRKDTLIDKQKQVITKFSVALKVVKSGNLVAKTQFFVQEDASTVFTSAEVRNGGGLDSVQHIVSIIFSGEACGIPTIYYPYAWNGTTLIPMPKLMEISDADVFYHTEKFILPSDKGGKKGIVVIDIEEAESTEKQNKRGETIFKSTKLTKQYSWNLVGFKELKL